jgi:hypothetical protein
VRTKLAQLGANDTASVDDAALVAATIRELEPAHVRALAILAGYKQQYPDASGVAAVIEGMAGFRTRMPEKVSGTSGIPRALMGTSDDVADALSATLERQGLVWNDPSDFGAWGLPTTVGGSSHCSKMQKSTPCGSRRPVRRPSRQRMRHGMALLAAEECDWSALFLCVTWSHKRCLTRPLPVKYFR